MAEPFSLKPGDVVSYDVEDYVVENEVTYKGARLSWTEWVLNPGDIDQRVIIARIGSELLVGRPCWVEGQPGDQMVRVEGALLDLKDKGRADVSMTYDTGATQFDRAEFWHYGDGTGRRVMIRRGHLGEWAINARPIDPAELVVYGS